MRAWCRHSRSTAFPATRSNRRYRRRGVDHTPPAFLDPNRIVGQDHRWAYGENRFQLIGAIEGRVWCEIASAQANIKSTWSGETDCYNSSLNLWKARMTTTAEALPAGIVKAVEAGHTVTVKRNGKPFAQIRPLRAPSRIEIARQCALANESDKQDHWQRLIEWPAD